ncbi:MAG: SCO4848 family membrane protein [Nakamurella sp.]
MVGDLAELRRRSVRESAKTADGRFNFSTPDAGDTGPVILSRGWSLFLMAAGVFNWIIWPRFALAIWNDQRAWSGSVGQSSPTAFLVVHAVLIGTAVTVGTIVGVLGLRGFLAGRKRGNQATGFDEESTPGSTRDVTRAATGTSGSRK